MQNPRITEEEIGIIKKAQSGNITAFNQLFKKYKGFVEQILYDYLKDKDEARDITNIVFLKVHDKLSTFTEYNSFGGWLRIIANRTAIDYLRRVKDETVLISQTESWPDSKELIEHNEDEIINHLTYEKLLSEFNKLPEQTKQIFNLFYIEELTVEEISKQLSIPIGTIKSTLFRTRKHIKQKLNIN